MDNNLDKMREKLFSTFEHGSDYTIEDFHKEFGYNTNTTLNVDFRVGTNFTNKSNNPDPEYGTEFSSGFDLRANLSESITLNPFERAIIPTGLFFELPQNFEIQVRPRSGLAAKHGITVLNTPGTIDEDYRGEIKVILINLGQEPFVVNHGERIAQAVFSTVTAKRVIKLNKVNEISTETDRGAGGFGHTGVK